MSIKDSVGLLTCISSHGYSGFLPIGSNNKVFLNCSKIINHSQSFSNKYTVSSCYVLTGSGNRKLKINEANLAFTELSVGGWMEEENRHE